MRWVGDADTTSGVAERRFELDVDGRAVPGILWLPPDGPVGGSGPRPLVLVGHGATLHKRVDHIVALAHLLVRQHGFAAAALDAPGHGDRRPDLDADEVQLFSNFLAEWSRPGSTDDVIAEWRAAIDALRDLDEVGDGPLGYWGLSMGTIYGVPLAAAEPRVQVAVFGLMGLLGPTRDRMEHDGRALACPLAFILQWHDQLVGRDDSFALFDALGSIDKRLHAHPGEHAAVPPEELLFSVEFLARHLAPRAS
ncbi:MAG: dienelactone hydrolase family protein [Acidimicrobiales bacterium]